MGPTGEPMGEFIKEFGKQYGQTAFGVIMLLVIWLAIIDPIMKRQNLDFEAQRNILESQNATLDSQKSMLKDQDRLSENMKQTAIILERIITRMESVSAEGGTN